ncbi:MAG: CopG family transcriptional regulator [bacterium]
MSRLKEPKATIKIPRPLYNRLKTIISESGFDSVTDFVVYVLRDIAAVAGESDDAGNSIDFDQVQLSGEEVRKVRERLRRLGYL